MEASAAEGSPRVRRASKEEGAALSVSQSPGLCPEPNMAATMRTEGQRDHTDLGEDGYSVDSAGGGSSMGTAEEIVIAQRIRRFQSLLAAVKGGGASQLTYSTRPKQGQKFKASSVRWEGRHHVSMSQGNASLHNLHKDLFERPQPFDMCTKTRTALEAMPIKLRMERRMEAEAARRHAAENGPVEIHAKYGPKAGPTGQRAAERRRAMGSAVSPYGGPRMVVPLSQRPGPHTDSHLEPLAHAREEPGPRPLCVVASLSL
jgi:hypothetical protein